MQLPWSVTRVTMEFSCLCPHEIPRKIFNAIFVENFPRKIFRIIPCSINLGLLIRRIAEMFTGWAIKERIDGKKLF